MNMINGPWTRMNNSREMKDGKEKYAHPSRTEEFQNGCHFWTYYSWIKRGRIQAKNKLSCNDESFSKTEILQI